MTGATRAGVSSTVARLERALRGRGRFVIDAERRASVAVMLWEKAPGQTRALYIQRTSRPDDPWSGQMAFPGGRVEPTDASAFEAALREAYEEVGVDLRQVARHVGTGDDIRAMARGKRLELVITPHVFQLEHELDESRLMLQADEVADVLWVPWEELLSGQRDGTFRLERPGMGVVKLPCFEVGGKVIWGLTYMMTRNLLDILERSTEHEGTTS